MCFIQRIGLIARFIWISVCALGITTGFVLASDLQFPKKPVRLIIPYSPGGGNDVVARVLAKSLSEIWGVQVVADNRPGANGLIGFEIAANAPDDGYTLVITSTSYVLIPVFHKPGVEPLGYLAPIASVAQSPLLLVAKSDFSARTVQDIIALAKSKPAQIGLASAGAGNQLAGVLFQRMAGISLLQIQYKGTGPAMIDVAGGHVPLLISSISPVLPYLQSGRLRALAIGSPSRSNLMPSVPTVAESGVPGYEASVWWGIMAPKATPKWILGKINKDINLAMKSEDVNQRFKMLGLEPLQLSTESFSRLVVSDFEKWGRLSKEAVQR